MCDFTYVSKSMPTFAQAILGRGLTRLNVTDSDQMWEVSEKCLAPRGYRQHNTAHTRTIRAPSSESSLQM